MIEARSCSAWLSSLLLMAAPAVRAEAPPAWYGAAAGGMTMTTVVVTQDAFGQPSGELATTELRAFTFGNRLFNTNWVAAPASVSAFDGLGPLFNRVSCSACHTRDGRGQPPATPEQTLESMLVRISLPGRGPHGEPLPVPGYGDQLNEKAVPGVAAEGRTVVHYREQKGRYPDGTTFSLAVPSYSWEDLAYGTWPADVRVSARVAPPVFGLGLLEAVPEASVLSAADPEDRDHDGISGRPNYVWDVVNQRRALGRFGWKSNQPHLLQQNAAAALGDIGLRTRLFMRENVAPEQHAALQAPSGAAQDEPELSDEHLERLTFYVRALAVPAARNLEDPAARSGAALFERARCSACHTPSFKTGDQPTFPQLAFQVIHPFSDLLLHDMGEGLADDRPDFEADGREWRTAPLWGIGLTRTVNRHTRFLHDGRARSLEEAILWHDGEARAARDAFMNFSFNERAALLRFLENL